MQTRCSHTPITQVFSLLFSRSQADCDFGNADHVLWRLLLPQRVGAAGVRGGLRVRQRVGEPGVVRGGGLLSERVERRKGVWRRLLLPLRVDGYDAMPRGVRVRVLQHVRPNHMRRGELLRCRCLDHGQLCAGKLLSPRLVKPECVPGRLLLPQRVGAAAVRGGLRVRDRVGEPAEVQGWELLHCGLNQW